MPRGLMIIHLSSILEANRETRDRKSFVTRKNPAGQSLRLQADRLMARAEALLGYF